MVRGIAMQESGYTESITLTALLPRWWGRSTPFMTLVVNGATYSNVPIFNRRSIVALAVDPGNAGTVYVGTNDFNYQGLGTDHPPGTAPYGLYRTITALQRLTR